MRAGDGKYAAAHVLQFFAACYAGGMRLFPDKEDRSGGCILGRSVRVVFGGCVFVPLSVVGVSAGDYGMKIFGQSYIFVEREFFDGVLRGSFFDAQPHAEEVCR